MDSTGISVRTLRGGQCGRWMALGIVVALAGACDGPPPSDSNPPETAPRRVLGAEIHEFDLRGAAKKQVLPVYPKSSLFRRSTGVAVAALNIDSDGRLTALDILEAPDADIAEAVRHAIKQWEFPSTTTGKGEFLQRIPVSSKLTFYFKIDPAGNGAVAAPVLKSVPTGQTQAVEVRAGAAGRGWVRSNRAVLVDIRRREEYRAGHTNGAVNLPVDEMQTLTNAVPSQRAVAIECYDGMMQLCQMAASELLRAGHTRATILVK